MSILLLTSRGAAWDWLLYAAGHKETGVGNKRLIRTIDGVSLHSIAIATASRHRRWYVHVTGAAHRQWPVPPSAHPFGG